MLEVYRPSKLRFGRKARSQALPVSLTAAGRPQPSASAGETGRLMVGLSATRGSCFRPGAERAGTP